MSPVDHNKTLVLLYSFLSLTFILPLVGSPWIVAKSVRNSEQIPYCNGGGFRSPRIGPTLHGNSSRALSKKALRTRVGPSFCGAGVTYMLADGGLYLAVHAQGGWQKAV
jgi:hypothetical protein